MSELPWREYDAAAQRALGVRYATVCEVAAGAAGGYDHGYLLWADEPFTEEHVAREMAARGFTVTAVAEGRSAWHPWVVRVSAGPDTAEPRYVVAFGSDYATVGWLGLWSPSAGLVVHHSPEQGWRTVPTLHTLYSDKGFWEDPHDWVAVVTPEQADRIAAQLGCRLPGVDELGARVGAELDLRRRRKALWADFTALRRERFAVEVRQVLDEAERLAAVEPLRREVRYVKDRERAAEQIRAIRVPIGEPFPLVRFLIGSFPRRREEQRHERRAEQGYQRREEQRHERRAEQGYQRREEQGHARREEQGHARREEQGHARNAEQGQERKEMGRHEAVCNRVEVTTPDGERLELVLDITLGPATGSYEDAFTPYCPAEAAYRDDPAFPPFLAGEQHVPPLVFPVSPAALTIAARPLPASREPGVWRDLQLLLTFPDGTEYATLRGWSGDGFRWSRFRSGRDGDLFVPDDIDVLKSVQARLSL